MPKKKYIVSLDAEEREYLKTLISSGKHAAQTLTRARVLLKSDVNNEKGGWSDQQIAQALDVGSSMIERVRQKFVLEGLEASIFRPKSSRIYERLLDGKQEAQLIALACSPQPEGYARWTLRLLAERMVELKHVESISHETVRVVLKKMSFSLGRRSAG